MVVRSVLARSHHKAPASDRTPRVSSGPAWAARKETHPACGTPCATGPDSHRGIGASGGRVVRATPRLSESLPPGALGGVLMVESREGKGAGQAPTKVDGNRSPHEVCAGRLTRNAKNSQATDSRVLGGHPPRFHLQSTFGRGVKLPSPLQLLWKREKDDCSARVHRPGSMGRVR